MKQRQLCIHCKHHALDYGLFDEHWHVCKLNVVKVNDVTGNDQLGRCQDTVGGKLCDFQSKTSLTQELLAWAFS